MSEKRYFKIEYDEEWYLFDSTTISEQLVEEQAEYGYGVFANSLSPSEICERLNEQQDTIFKLQDLCGESDSENAKLKIENKRLQEENEQLRKQCFELENDYVIETSDISDKIYLDDEIKELEQKYSVTDE